MILNKNSGECILRIAIGMMVALLLSGGGSAATLTVNASGGADYTRIQDAIDNATTGDMVLVYSGTYFENVNVNKRLTMLGIGMPVVDAKGSGSAITLSAGRSTLDGFMAINSSGWPDAGIYVNSNKNMLNNNTASKNVYGIILWNSNDNTLNNNNASYNIYETYSNNSGGWGSF